MSASYRTSTTKLEVMRDSTSSEGQGLRGAVSKAQDTKSSRNVLILPTSVGLSKVPSKGTILFNSTACPERVKLNVSLTGQIPYLGRNHAF